MTTWQERLKDDRKRMRELHQNYGDAIEEILLDLEEDEEEIRYRDLLKDLQEISNEHAERRKNIKLLINQFDNASEDEKRLEIAGRLISLVQKVML